MCASHNCNNNRPYVAKKNFTPNIRFVKIIRKRENLVGENWKLIRNFSSFGYRRRITVSTRNEMFFPTLLLAGTISRVFACDIENLMAAVENRNMDEVKVLLDTVDVTWKNQFGWNVLHAAVNSDGEIIRLLISRGADKVVNDKCFITGVSPILLACIKMEFARPHSYEIMEAMLKAGGDPNVWNSDLQTPLHITTRGPEARLLISYGADVNAKDMHGYTPLMTFFVRQYHGKNHEVVHALADGNADFAITDEYGDTIFHMKSKLDASLWTKEFVTFLARNGVPLDALNDNGETALTNDYIWYFKDIYENITYENLKCSFMAYMAEAGADLSAKNKRGETLLHIAVLNYEADTVKWLLENGANVEAVCVDGDTPLLALIKREIWEYEYYDYFFPGKDKGDNIWAVIDVLAEGGADFHFLDEYGHDADYYLRKLRTPSADWDVEDCVEGADVEGCGGISKSQPR